METRHALKCPLAAVDKRLEDVHRLWHQAADEYFDPDGFRVAIQNAIQSLRTVTFILQKNKASIPDFDKWYPKWQATMKADTLLAWIVDARNIIEKEGDLESQSIVRAQIVASYKEDGDALDIAADLFDTPVKLLEQIPAGPEGKHIWENGVLRVQRRWVANSLPAYELLDAVANAYGKISLLVNDAHRQTGLAIPDIVDETSGEVVPGGLADGKLPCMIGSTGPRTILFNLKSGEIVSYKKTSQALDQSKAPEVLARYGSTPTPLKGRSDIEILSNMFETARRVFEKDGFHITSALLLREGAICKLMSLTFETRSDKYLIMREVAHEVERTNADALIFISEAWTATHKLGDPFVFPTERQDREEELIASLISRSGISKTLSAKIMRSGKGTSLGPTFNSGTDLTGSFAPVVEVWKRTASAAGQPPSPKED